MKKQYIKPNAKAICLLHEESLLIVTSMTINDEAGEIDGGMTNHQESNSLWDNWSD